MSQLTENDIKDLSKQGERTKASYFIEKDKLIVNLEKQQSGFNVKEASQENLFIKEISSVKKQEMHSQKNVSGAPFYISGIVTVGVCLYLTRDPRGWLFVTDAQWGGVFISLIIGAFIISKFYKTEVIDEFEDIIIETAGGKEIRFSVDKGQGDVLIKNLDK